jgi:hypothetical protein
VIETNIQKMMAGQSVGSVPARGSLLDVLRIVAVAPATQKTPTIAALLVDATFAEDMGLSRSPVPMPTDDRRR